MRVFQPSTLFIYKLAFYSKANHPQMRVFSYSGSLPVTWQKWPHTIRSATAVSPHAARKLHGSIETELLPTEVLHCGNRDFLYFCSCDLDLDPVTFIYEFNPYPIELYRMCEKNFLRQAFESYCIHITDRQTNALEIIYHVASPVVKK